MSTIVLRSVKGLPLTNSEVDDNFTNLNTDKLQIGGTYSSGTTNGVPYLNASKVLTSGTALTFDGTNLRIGTGTTITKIEPRTLNFYNAGSSDGLIVSTDDTSSFTSIAVNKSTVKFYASNSEGMRLTSTGLGIGTSSPTNALSVTGNANITGNTTLGDATTDTVTVNGYMGVGGAGASSVGVFVTSAALTGVNQTGVLSTPTATSAATTSLRPFYSDGATVAASFTLAEFSNFYAGAGVKGAGSTITNKYGLRVVNQSIGGNNFGVASEVSSGTNKWNIYASGTAANYFAGNVLINTTSGVPAWASGGQARLQVAASNAHSALSAVGFGAANPVHSGMLVLGKSRGAIGNLTETNSNDVLGFISFEGVNTSSTFISGAYIRATQTGAAGASNIPAALQFFTSSGSADPIERLHIDSAGNVGIGTTPSSRLSIAAINATVYTSTGATASPVGAVTSIQNLSNTDGGFSGLVLGSNQAAGTSGNTYIGNISSTASLAGTLVFGRRTGSATYAESMRIDSAGNLGLGVTPSAWRVDRKAFEVGNGASFYGTTYDNSANITSNAFINTSGVATYKTTGDATFYRTVSGQHQFFTAPSGTAGAAITFTQAMTLTAAGNLGIGTSSPATKLQIGDASATGGWSAVVRTTTSNMLLGQSGGSAFGFASGAASLVYEQLNTLVVGTAAAVPLVFGTNGSERLRIDSSGNLIQTVNTTAATLATNGTMTFSIVDNSTLRISVRGSDGTTRTATVALT